MGHHEMGKFARSWALAKASFGILRADKELLVFPLVSAVAVLLVCASFVLPMFGLGLFRGMQDGEGMQPVFYLWLFAFYLVQYFVIFFFNAALVGAAMIRLRGGDPTVADGFRIAFSKALPILGYAAIAATVGLLLRAIERRAGFIGRWIAAAIGVGWTIATFMAVPVLVNENVGPIDAVKKSATMLRKTWGENILGNAGIGLVFGLLIALVAFLGVGVTLAASQNPSLFFTLGALTVVSVMLMVLVQAALSGIYSAALYRYAEEGTAGGTFDDALLSAAFRAK